MQKMLSDSTITDIPCPHCKSIHTQIIGTDEIEFEPGGTGHYHADCVCLDCKCGFRMYYKFEYRLLDAYCRK